MQNDQIARSVRRLSLFILVVSVVAPALAEQASLTENQGFASIKAILDRSCSACHPWTASYETIVGGGHVVDKDPNQSALWKMILDDTMPMAGPKLSADEKTLIRDWILAGAPATNEPIPGAKGQGAAAVLLASSGGVHLPARIIYHATTGFTAVATFAAAGTIGVVHFIQMKEVVHPGGFFAGGEGGSETMGDAETTAAIAQIWSQQQTGRWWHAGLVIGGEALYLGDAITGLSMLTKHTPGRLTKSDIHRYAFFTHASLMVAQVVLGFMETDAMSRGQHDAMLGYLGAHAVIGVTIPAIMLFAGLENILP